MQITTAYLENIGLPSVSQSITLYILPICSVPKWITSRIATTDMDAVQRRFIQFIATEWNSLYRCVS